MLRATMTAPGRIAFDQPPVPQPAAEQVLVRVRRIGVCGSDVHVFHGRHPYTSYPVVQGHEMVGEVEALGAGVTELVVGDHVALRPQLACGRCRTCRSGREHICERLRVMGFQAPGVAAQWVAIPVENLVRVPAHVPFDQAVFVEPVAVAVHALGKAAPLGGANVLVLGGGTIGNLTGQVARAAGARAVVITDPSPRKREIAREVGLANAFDPTRDDFREELVSAFGPDGPDVLVECVGAHASLAQAVELAPKGSTIVVVGVFGEPVLMNIGIVQDRELRVFGSLMYSRADVERAVVVVSSGDLQLGPLVSARFPLRGYRAAYEAIESDGDRSMKVLIDLDPGIGAAT